MKKTLLLKGIITTLAIIVLPCFVQGQEVDDDNSTYKSPEWLDNFAKEHYGINKATDMNLKQAKQMMWDLDVNDFINKYKFNIPIPDYSPKSVPQQGGLIIESGGSSSSSPRRSSGEDMFKKSSELRGKQIDETQQRARERMDAWRQELQHRAEIARRKREEENRRDRERGRAEYYARTAGFHAYNANRDRWMATEGVRHLKEDVHAMDMASAPKEKREDKLNIKDGNELADLLKGKDEITPIEVTVVERDDKHENEKNVSLSTGADNNIDFYGFGDYNQSNIDDWNAATKSTNGFVPSNLKWKKLNNEYESVQIFSKKELDISCFDITTLPGMGCVVLLGDSIVFLDTPNLQVLEWGKHAQLSDVVTCGTRTFGKQDNTITEITKEKLYILYSFNNSNFSIYNESDSSFVLCLRNLDLTIVNRINVENNTYDELLRITQPIEKIVANKKVVLAKYGFKIIDITDKPLLLYSSKERINDICMCSDGLLVATDKNVVLLQTQESVLSFSKNGAKRLWCDGEDIYLQDMKDNLIRYSKKKKL